MTDVKITATVTPRESILMASADQVSIFGNGTTEDPLRAETSFLATFDNPFADPNEPRVGNPVVTTDDDPTFGIATVRTGSAGLGSPQLPNVVGLLVEVGDLGNSGGQVAVRSSGPVTLTTDQWDLITGQTGGLTEAAAYYLDWSLNGFGHLTTVVPPDPGMARVLVGIAMSTTTMLLALPAVPIEVA